MNFEKANKESVLSKVLSDYNQAKQHRAIREEKWKDYYKKYRSYTQPVPDNRSNLFIPYSYSIVETVMPRIIETMFAVRPYIGLIPLRADQENKAQTIEKLIDYQLTQRIRIKHIAAMWVKDALIYGTGILKVGWKVEQRTSVVAEPLADFGEEIGELWGSDLVEGLTDEVEQLVTVYDDPVVDNVDLFDFYVDPSARNIDEAAYCIHREYINIDDIKENSGEDRIYDAAEVNKLIQELKGDKVNDLEAYGEQHDTGVFDRLSSVGYEGAPMTSDKIEVLEYWTNDRVIVVAGQRAVIRNEKNPYRLGKKPFVRIVDVPITGEFYGIGEIEPIADLQDELNTKRNQRVDNVSMIINRMWKVLRGANLDFNQLRSRSGGVVEVDDMADIEPIEFPHITGDAYHEDEQIRSDIDMTAGVHDYTRGGSPDRRETATTASILSEAANERFKLKVTLMEDLGLRRLGEWLVALNQQFIDEERVISINGAKGLEVFEVAPNRLLGDYDIIAIGSAVEPVANPDSRLNTLLNLYQQLAGNPYIKEPELIRAIIDAANIKDSESLMMDEGEIEQMMINQALQAAEEEMMAMEGGMGMGGGGDSPYPTNDTEFGVMENENM